MTRYFVEITVQVVDLSREDLENAFEPLADAVYGLDTVIDADLGMDLDGSRITFTMSVDAEDEPAALGTGLAAVRRAIQTAGGASAGWGDRFHAVQQELHREDALV